MFSYQNKNLNIIINAIKEKELSQEIEILFKAIFNAVVKIRQEIYIDFDVYSETNLKNFCQETQLKIDIHSNEYIIKELEKSEVVYACLSEELNNIHYCNKNGKFTVAFDPIDGSSSLKSSVPVGSIFGIWETKNVLNKSSEKYLKIACYVLYGVKTTFLIAFKNQGVLMFEENYQGDVQLLKKDFKLKETTNGFSPGNLKTCKTNNNYYKVIQDLIFKEKKLRYAGTMIQDIHSIFVNENGLFMYPGSEKNKNGKLRLLFECSPFALICEEVNGKAVNHNQERILDLIVKDYHQRTSIFIGSKQTIEEVMKIYHNH